MDPRSSSATGFATADLWAAWSTCRAARRRWLIADPLRYPEFELLGEPPRLEAREPPQVEVEFQTKQRPRGGLRLEVLPDVFTATYLQAVADRLGARELGLESSLSAGLFGVRLKEENPYQVWSSTVPAWIRNQIAQGRVVAMADVRDCFASIARGQIEAALRRAALEEPFLETTLALLDGINATPDREGGTRGGLPVSLEEIFWLIADLVLAPVDEAMRRAPAALAYARWVDDFFVAAAPGGAERACEALRRALSEHGLQLNEAKTRVLGSVEEFETAFLHGEHGVLTDLFMTETAGALSGPQQAAFSRLVERRDARSTEDARLWKRLYGLARRIGSPLLLGHALEDLRRIPSAELQILGYLGTLGWPDSVAEELVGAIAGGISDARAVGTLRVMLATSCPLSQSMRRMLRGLAMQAKPGVHPFCAVLAFACLLAGSEPAEALSDGTVLLARLPGLGSATARRFGTELLWLLPRLRPALREQAAADRSRAVRALLPLMARDAAAEPRSAAPARLASTPGRGLEWGRLDSRIAHEFHLV